MALSHPFAAAERIISILRLLWNTVSLSFLEPCSFVPRPPEHYCLRLSRGRRMARARLPSWRRFNNIRTAAIAGDKLIYLLKTIAGTKASHLNAKTACCVSVLLDTSVFHLRLQSQRAQNEPQFVTSTSFVTYRHHFLLQLPKQM